MDHTLRLVHSQTENLFHFNWCTECGSYDVVREARRIRFPEGPDQNVHYDRQILREILGKRNKKEFENMDENEVKRILDRQLAIERGKKAIRNNLNINIEDQNKTRKATRHQGYCSASKKMPCLSSLHHQQQPQWHVVRNTNREMLGGQKTCISSSSNAHSTFEEETTAEKEMNAFEENKYSESTISESTSSSGQESDVQRQRYVNAAVRFQAALEKENLEKKYAQTLELLEYAEKLYRKKCALEASKPSVQPNANMCPPLDQRILQEQEQKMEQLYYKKCKITKVLEHAIEDLEGYHDDIEENFQQPDRNTKAAESSDSLEELDLVSLRKSDSFIDKYFQSRRDRKEKSSTKEVQTSPVDEIDEISLKTHLSPQPAEITLDKPAESRNIAVQAKPSLSSKCIQADIQVKPKEAKESIKRETSQEKITETNLSNLSDVIDFLKHVASMPELKKLIEKSSSSSAPTSVRTGTAPAESDTDSASTSTVYYSLPRVIGCKPSLYTSQEQNVERQNTNIRDQRQISKEISESTVAKRLETTQSDTLTQETEGKRSESMVFYPPMSDVVDSDEDLFTYLRMLSTKITVQSENKENISNNSKQAIALSEPIRERSHLQEKQRHTVENVNSLSAEIPKKGSLGMLSSEDIVKAQQREYFIRESIRKVMGTTSGDLDGLADVPQERLTSDRIILPTRAKSDTSLGSVPSTSSSPRDKYEDLSLIPNLSYVDIAQESSNSIQVEEKSELPQTLHAPETSTKNFKILEQVLKNRLEDFHTSLENKSYSTGEINANSEKSSRGIMEEQKKIPFIYHDLSTIQEVDSILTDSPSTSYADNKHESNDSTKISKRSLSLQKYNYDNQGLHIGKPENQHANIAKSSSLSTSSNDPSETAIQIPSVKKIQVNAVTNKKLQTSSARKLSSTPSNATRKIAEAKISEVTKDSIIRSSSDIEAQTEDHISSAISRSKTTPHPGTAEQSLPHLSKNLLIDAANSMMSSESLSLGLSFRFSHPISESSSTATTKSSSVNSYFPAPSERALKSRNESPDLQSERHGTNVEIPTSSSPESNFQPLSLISDFDSMPSQSSGSGLGVRAIDKQVSASTNVDIPAYVDSSSESSFRPLTPITDAASMSSHKLLSQRHSKATDKQRFVPRNVLSSPNLPNKLTSTVVTKNNLLADSTKATVEALLSGSGGSFEPLSLMWSGSRSQSLSSFQKPVKVISTQTASKKVPDITKSAVAIMQTQHQKHGASSSRSFLPVTPDVGRMRPSSSEEQASQQIPSSPSSSSRFISLSTVKRIDALKDLNQGNVAYCSSSDENLSEIFAGSRIFHQSTPIKEYEDLPEEKGILDEPDLTLVGSSIDSTTEEICKSFSGERSTAEEHTDNERTIIGSGSKTCSVRSTTSVPHAHDVSESESVLSFLQHEKSSLPSAVEHVLLASSSSSSEENKK